MKKALFATTAIVAAGLASAASAAEWSTSVNGYWFVGMSVTDNSIGANDGAGVLRDGEIHFRSSLKADNGLTFTSRVELEAFTTGDQIDENWASVSGSFGTVMIGGNDDQSYNHNVGILYAPGARIGYYDAFGLNTGAGGANRFTNGPAAGVDPLGIHYTTPNFNGFSAGVTYIPNTGADNAGDTNFPANSNQNFWALGANYSGDFDGFGFGVSAGYTDSEGNNNETWTIGANVSAAGFTLAGTFEDDQTEEYAIGVQYKTGPITVAAGYSDGQGADEQTIAGWLTYAIAPGVSGTVAVEHFDDNQAGVEGIGGLAYLALSF
ncbi:MAG: porin [Pikeienuella sp.]